MAFKLIKRGVELGGLIAAGVVGARKIDQRWAQAQDPNSPEHYVIPSGESMTIITDDGAELAITIAGAGPTVVLSHCWTGSREVWAPVAHRLIISGHRVVLYDQRGHGSSTVGSDGCTIARLGGDLAAILEQLDIRDAVVVGHSMGSMTVLSLAAHHRDVLVKRARGLVLVSTAANGLGFGPLGPLMQKAIAAPFINPVMRSSIGHSLVRATFGKHVTRRQLVLTRDAFVACTPSVREAFLASMQSMDLRQGIRGLDIPTTVVSGRFDILTPPWLAREVVSCIPGSNLVQMSDGGHMLVLEDPDQIEDIITSMVLSNEPVVSLN